MQSHQGGGGAAVSSELAMTGRDAADVACWAIDLLREALSECPPADEICKIGWGETLKRMSNVMTWAVDVMNRTTLVTKDDVCMLRELSKALHTMQALMRHRDMQSVALYTLLVGYEEECLEVAAAAEAAIRLASDAATEVNAAPLRPDNVSWYGNQPRF